MSRHEIRLPKVEHSYEHHHLDGPRWAKFVRRPDDIIIATSYKAGTTWMQTIIANLLFSDGNLPGPVQDVSPWLDFRMAPADNIFETLDAQSHRRFIKTHLPLDGIPYFTDVQYVVVGRDARDVFMSLVNHYGNYNPKIIDMMNTVPGRTWDVLEPYDGDIHKLWKNWMTKGSFPWELDGFPYWSHLHHVQTWWDFRHLPNIHFAHYQDLTNDLDGEMRRIADVLNIVVPEEHWASVVTAAKFETVKKNPEKVLADRVNFSFRGGAQTFINKGTNGRWRDVLSKEELALYDAAADRVLSHECRLWLENGGSHRPKESS